MFTFHGKRRLSDVQKPLSLWVVHGLRAQNNVQATTHEGSPRSMSTGRRLLNDVNGHSRCCQSTLDRYAQTTSDAVVYDLCRLSSAICDWSMSLSRSKYALYYASICQLTLMSPCRSAHSTTYVSCWWATLLARNASALGNDT